MLKKSEFLKSRKIQIVLCVEILLILIGVFGLFGKSGVIYSTEDMKTLVEEGISMSPGVYTLRIHYNAQGSDSASFDITTESNMFNALLSNRVFLRNGLSEVDCQFYLLDSVDNLKLVLNISEDVQIERAEVIAGHEGSRIYLFYVIILSLILDMVLIYALYCRKYPVSTEKTIALLAVPAFAVISSIPVMVDYNIIGADLVYHLLRIEALANSIRCGELSVRIQSFWLSGHGYASSIFYGDTFLALPALLRILGFNLSDAYGIFVLVVNLATAWIAYISFSGCFRNRYIGALGCALYTLVPYRMYNIYNRAAVGEYTAMIFLPLLVWGFYRIYTEDSGKKGYLWNWVIPVIGFSGVIQSHALTCEMAGVFVVFLCLILWKKTFQKRTFLVLCSTVVMTLIVNAWFLVPFIDMMFSDSYYFQHNANALIQNRGILPAQIFYTLQAGGSSSRFAETGMLDTEPIGLGAALLISMLLWLFFRNRYKGDNLSEQLRRERWAGDVGFVLTCIALFMSTCYFPWDFLSSHSRLLANLIGPLQFPTRITAIVTITGVFTACVAGVWALREKELFLSGKAILALITLVCVLFGNYQLNSILLTREEFIRLYSVQNAGTTGVLGAEYLPEGADIFHMVYHAPVLAEGVVMEEYEKNGLEVTAEVTTKDEAWIDFPMLYYKGYQAETQGESLTVEPGENHDVRVLLPGDFNGSIRVWYAGMWYWHLAEVISLLAGTGFLVYYVVRRFRGSRRNTGNEDLLEVL